MTEFWTCSFSAQEESKQMIAPFKNDQTHVRARRKIDPFYRRERYDRSFTRNSMSGVLKASKDE